MPFVVAWKGHITPTVMEHPVIQLDLTATALNLAGADTANLDGVDLLPWLAGKRTGVPHEALYWRFGEQMAIRAGNFKLVRYDSNVDTRTGVRNQPVSGPRLYNLQKDIGETNDLYAAMPDKARELQAKWDVWNGTLSKPLWSAGTPEGKAKKKKRMRVMDK